MTKVFTADLFFIFQQSFCIFPVNKLDNYPFVVTSTIPWERELVTTLNISNAHIYYSLASTSIILVISKSSSQILFDMPDSSILFLRLYCFHFAWFFSKFMILSSNLQFTFFVITSSLVSFLFSAEIWSIASVSLCIWSDTLYKSESTITFPFRSSIFYTRSDFFNEFNADSEIF